MQPSALAKVLILTAFAAWFFSILLIPVIRWGACRIGLVDRPDPTRKLHRGEIALAGGLAIFVSGLITMLVVQRSIIPTYSAEMLAWGDRWLGLLFASLAMVVLGVIDDRYNLRGKHKLLGQIAIVSGLAYVWQPTGQVSLFGWDVGLGSMTYPVLVFWLLATINAVNLIDGADGAAGSFGLVAAAGISLCAFITGQQEVAIVAAALGASLAGFLCFNRPPASIFLGDSGSMLLGLVLGTLACWSVHRGKESQDLLIPIALLGVPLFDSLVAVMRRVLTGRSIYTADRGHLHHTLQAHFKAKTLSPMWMIIAFGGLSLLTSSGAIVGILFRSDFLALMAILILMLGLMWTKIFGHAEARLLASHTLRMSDSFVSKVRRMEPKVHVSGVPLQGNREWDGVWQPLVEFAEKNGLWRMKLDLNMPWQHEGYHGVWARGEMPDKSEQWTVRIPIFCQERSIGRLEIIGRSEGNCQIQSLESFSFLINELQPEIERMVQCLTPAKDSQEAVAKQPKTKETTEDRRKKRVRIAAAE